MNRETYDDPGVRKHLLEHFIPVRVDQDSRPDISQRYERWGWPATIIFGPDGTEIVKLRGFFSPQFFMPVLVETVKDPSPVDYGTRGGPERGRTLARSLTEAQRAEIRAFIDQSYDAVSQGRRPGDHAADQKDHGALARPGARRHRRRVAGLAQARLVGAGA